MREAILREIMLEYENIRMEELRERQAREKELMDAIPELARIRQEIIELMAQRSRDIIKDPVGSAKAISDLQRRLAELKAKEGQLLSEKGYPSDYLAPRYRCEKCKDTGFVGDPVKERCSCFVQKILERTYRLANSKELERQNFQTFDAGIFPDTPMEEGKMSQRQYMLQIKERLEKYVEEFPNNSRKIILFTGRTGLGKSFLLNCITKAILDKCYTALQISAYKLFDRLFKASFDSNEERTELQSQLFEVDALIIDDLGTETLLNNFTSEGLFHVVNERALQNKHTFFSTNLSLAELRDRYSDRITSRLFDTSNSMIIRFLGKDVRLQPK